MNKLTYITALCLLLICNTTSAQNRLSLTNRSPIFVDLNASLSTGKPKQVVTVDSQWLNYTTLVDPSEPTFSISVEVASGTIPEGMELQMEASQYVGMSKGRPGTPTGKITVTNMPRVLIDNISTFYTGSGRNEGHKLTFSFIIKDYAKLQSGSTNLYIQYTITQ